jgi:HipA-like protein
VVLERAGKRILVGSLTEEGREYVFRYAESFKRQQEIPPISAFPDVDEEYRSRQLWPFFSVRLPPLDRPDIEELLRERGLKKEDALALLAALARKPISTPFEFEMTAA